MKEAYQCAFIIRERSRVVTESVMEGMQTNAQALDDRTIEEMGVHCLFRILTQLVPGIRLGDNIFAQRFGEFAFHELGVSIGRVLEVRAASVARTDNQDSHGGPPKVPAARPAKIVA